MEISKKRVIIKLAVTVGILLVIFFVFPEQRTPASGKINGEVINELAEKGNVRVIVYMKEGSEEPRGNFLGINLASDKERVIDQIGDEMRHDLGNAVSAEMNKAEILALTSSDAVTSIELVNSRDLFLMESTKIIESGAINKLEYKESKLTGEGETVCILDTGVDYMHDDLGNCSNATFLNKSCEKVIDGYDYANMDNNPIDDHGHGTHVAGIIAADGRLKGIAPKAKIAAIKVCSASGVCYDDDLMAGIKWCTDNKERLNISVISMSLGSGLYTDYCNDDVLADYINNATIQNISVVIASGNHGSKNSISAPACMQNATPVGSTTKTDGVSSFSNRNSLLKIVAPGSLIYSTLTNERYANLSGTSMATPHVSGAIAIINQYLRLKNKTITPEEIENLLFITGKAIDDSLGSGLNYSRINVLKAMAGMDDEKPEVNAIGKVNENFDIKEIEFCNGSDFSLSEANLIVWNSTDKIFEQKENISLTSKYEQWANFTNMSYGVYYWNCGYKDISESYAELAKNASLVISDLIANGDYPIDNSLISGDSVGFACNASSQFGLKSISFNVINSSNDLIFANITSISGIENSSIFNVLIEKDGNYIWTCSAVDNLGGAKISEERRFIFESNNLNIEISSPANGSIVKETILNISTDRKSECDYITNSSGSRMQTEDNFIFIKENLSFDKGSYKIDFMCYSFDGKQGNASVSFSIDNKSPAVALISPSNDASLNKGNIEFRYSADEESECKLIIGNSNYTINNTKVLSLNIGSYVWKIECTDKIGNIGISESRALVVIEGTSKTDKENKPSSSSSSASTTKTSAINTNQTINKTEEKTVEPEKEIIASTELKGAKTIAGQAIREDITEEEMSIFKQRAVVLGILVMIGIVGAIVVLFYKKGKPLFSAEEEELLEHKLK
jgi:hypothetical protein